MNKKTITILVLIIATFALITGGMYFYYTRYVSSLTPATVATTSDTGSLPLLPTLSEDTAGNNTNGESEVLGSSDPASDIYKIENSLPGNEELLADLKPAVVEDMSVAAYIALQGSTTTPGILRYIRKDTGEVVDYNPKLKSVEIKSAGQGVVGEASFSRDGQYAVLRSETESGIATKLLRIDGNITTDLENNIDSITFSKDNKSLIYGVVKSDGYLIKLYNLKTLKAKDLAKLELTEWSLESVQDGTIRANYKPSSGLEGIAIIINPSTGASRIDSRPIKGLVTKEIDSKKYYLLSSGDTGRNELLFANKQTGDIFSLGENTFVEKCSYELLKTGIVCAVPKRLPDQKPYPDYWYQSRLTTLDKLIYKHLSSTSST
jgi:hypothetical protein